MKRSPLAHEIRRLSWNLQLHYRLYNSLPLDSSRIEFALSLRIFFNANFNIYIFWGFTPSIPVDKSCILKMDLASSPETLVYIYQIILCHFPTTEILTFAVMRA